MPGGSAARRWTTARSSTPTSCRLLNSSTRCSRERSSSRRFSSPACGGCRPGLQGVASPEFQYLSLERVVLARQPGQDLAAEGIDVGADVVREGVPELVVDHVDADEAARHAPALWTRVGLGRRRALEQPLGYPEPLLVERPDLAAGADRLGGGLGGQPELEDEKLGRRELLGERRALDACQVRRQALALLGDQDRAGEAHALPGLGKACDEVR